MQAYTKDMKQKSCDVCQIAFDREKNFQEIGAVTISCYGCSQSCHLYCYGLQTKIEMEVTKEQGYFACDRCNVNSKQDYPCYVCQQKSGLKKLIENTTDEFVHPICGLFSKALEVTSFYSLSFRKSQQPPSQIKCSICNSKGAYSRCCDDSCDKNAHLYCILQGINDIGGITLNYSEVESNSKVWNLKYRYEQLFTRAQLNGSIHEIKNSIKTQAKSTMKQFFTIQQTTVDVDVDALFDQYSQIEQMEEERLQVVAIYCPEHKKEDMFCSCQMITQQQDQMIQCDTCSEWYHQDCLPDPEPQNFASIADQEHYLCQFCRQLNQSKQSKILKLQLVQDLSQLLPNYYNINIQILILLGIYCERSIQKLLKNYDEQAMRVTESLLANLPFYQALQSQVSKLKEKSHLQDFLNFVLRNSQYRSDNWIIKSQLNPDFTPCNANIQANNKLKQKIQKVQALFGGTQEQFFNSLDRELAIIQEVFELITKNQKMTVDQQLYFRQLNGYNEFEWFKAQDMKYRQFIQNLNQMFQEKQMFFEEQYEIIEGDECLFYLKEKSQLHDIDYDNFRLAQNKTKIWLNQQKIPAQEMINIINLADKLPFDVSWLDKIKEVIEKTSNFIQQQDITNQKYCDIDETNQYLSRIENDLFYYKDDTELFEFDAEIQKFEQRIEDLKLLVDNGSSDSELMQEKERTYSQKFSLEQLQELLKQAKQYEAPETYFKAINEGIQEINRIKRQINEMLLQKNMNDYDRKQFQAEIKLINQFDIPELTLLQRKIEIFEKVEKIKQSKQSTLDQVKQALQLCQQYSFDDKIQIALQNEIDKAQVIQQRIQSLLNHEIFGQEELDDAKEILQLINQSKVIIDQKEQVQSIQKGITFISELYDFYLEFKSPDQEMEIETDKKIDLQYQINQIKDPQNILFKESDKFVQELERILKKKTILLDQRIKQIHQQYTDLLYLQLSAKLVTDWKNGLEIEYKLIEKLSGCEIIKDFVQTYQEDQEKMLLLLQQMTQLVNIRNQQLVSEWIDNYNIIAVRVKGGKWDELKLAFLWIQIIQKYIEAVESPQCTYESLRLIQDLMIQTNFPRRSTLYLELDSKIQRFQNLIQKLRDYNQQRELYFLKQEQKKYRQQYQYTAAFQLQQWLLSEKINYDFIATDFNEDIQRVQEVQTIFYGDMKEENSDLQLYKALQQCFIADYQTHDQLKIRIYLQKIRENNNGVKILELPKARKILNAMNSLLRNNPIDDKEEIERFAQNVQIAEKISNLTQRLGDATSYTFEDLEQCSEQMEFIKNILVDNSQNIELLYEECKQCKYQVDEIIKKSIKQEELVIQNLLERVRKLPLQQEYSVLLNWWEVYQQLKQKVSFTRSELTRQKQNPNSKELTQLMNQLIQLNNICMIQNTDSEILLKNYKECQEKLDYFENNLNDDNIIEDFNSILPIFKWGDQYQRVRNLIWIKQVNNFKENPQIKWSIRQLKNVLHQGYETLDNLMQEKLKQQIEKLKQPINYLEQLMSKCIEHVMSQDSEQYVENKINVLELSLEIRDITNSSQRAALIKEFQPRRPFDDLQNYQNQKNKLKLVQKPEEKSQKQKEQSKKLIQSSFSKVEEQVKKKSKVEEPQVHQTLRDAKRKELVEILSQNKYFNNPKKEPNASFFENITKNLEYQVFGEFSNKKQQYVERMNKLIQVMKELAKYEYLSTRLLQKSFASESLSLIAKKYESNTLSQLEDSIKQKHQQKSSNYNPLAIKSSSSLLKPTQVIQQPQKKPDQQMKLKSTSQSSKNLLDQLLEDDGEYKPIQPQFIQPQKQQVQQIQIKSQPTTNQKMKSKSPSPKSFGKRSDSSDLPEFQQRISDAINYNPDANQEPIPKTQTLRQLQELTYSDTIHKLGKKLKLKIDRHQNEKEKYSINVELYTQSNHEDLKYLHNISSQELRLSQNSYTNDLRYLEEYYTQKEQPSIVSGWVFPEKYGELGEVNKYAEYLRNKKISQSSKHEYVIIYFFHVDNIRDSLLFKQLTIPEIVTEGQLSKKDTGIYKHYGNAFSKLAFAILIKHCKSIDLSNVVKMSIEKQKNMIGSQELKNFIEKVKKEKNAKQQQQLLQEQSQQEQQIQKPNQPQQYEPISSDEDNGQDLGQLILGMPALLEQIYTPSQPSQPSQPS